MKFRNGWRMARTSVRRKPLDARVSLFMRLSSVESSLRSRCSSQKLGGQRSLLPFTCKSEVEWFGEEGKLGSILYD